MSFKPKQYITFAFLFLLAGCFPPTTFPPVSPSGDGVFKVQPHDVINIVKCEMNDFYENYQYNKLGDDLKLDPNGYSEVELKLKLEAEGLAKGGVKTIPAAQLVGASLGANLSGSMKDTTETEIHYTVWQRHAQGKMDPSACKEHRDSLGINSALADFFKSQSKIKTGSPYVRFQDIVFSTSFFVKVEAGINGSSPTIYVVPLSPSLDLSATANETHFLKIKFKGKNKGGD